MSFAEKTKECAGTLSCRFRWVLRLAVALFILSVVVIWFFLPTQ